MRNRPISIVEGKPDTPEALITLTGRPSMLLFFPQIRVLSMPWVNGRNTSECVGEDTLEARIHRISI